MGSLDVVRGVTIAFCDNNGITRSRTVPLGGLDFRPVLRQTVAQPQQPIGVLLGVSDVSPPDDHLVLDREQSVDALRRCRHAKAFGTRQAVGCRVDPDHRAHFKRAGTSDHLDHQVGADVS